MSTKSELLETFSVLASAKRDELDTISAIINNPKIMMIIGKLNTLTKSELDRVKSVLLVKLRNQPKK